MPNDVAAVGMKMAKPSEADNRAVLEFYNGLESIIEYEEFPEGYISRDQTGSHRFQDDMVAEWIRVKWPIVSASWSRVYWAGVTAIDNACDPKQSTLEFKPEILAALRAAKGEG